MTESSVVLWGPTVFTDDRDPLDVLAEEFAERLRRGERPSVSDYAAAHPDHAAELKELLPAVAQMEMLKRFRAPAAVAPPALPDRLGDFRIVRELGRGGMGIVFEAVQESLGRPVALKVLARHAQLDPARRERFVREAQAAAKLHHTNIVPVFGVGEQDGLPYYVMQLIPGCGLHAVVHEWRVQTGKISRAQELTLGLDPDTSPAARSAADEPPRVNGHRLPDHGDWRFIADTGIQAAYALHYAHKQGVLHRDVKPANLILDGETVWVADFGLAKLMNADGLTATGDILGTLQYLPPECLSGDADARSDVYGLGATLYELLTLEPPYAADTPARLIKQVADTDPPAPRKLNPNIPQDLETIVLKATAREPRARYATARDLAEDLEAFLDDRPIRARRTTAISRGWKWCRRNPAVASLAASTLFAVSFAAVTGWVGYAGAEARRKEAEGERNRAKDEKAAADAARTDAQQKSAQLKANLDLSLKTFEKVFEAASGTGRPGFGVPLYAALGGPGGPGGFKDRPFEPGGFKGGFEPKGPGGGPKGGAKDGPNPATGPAAESASDMAAVLETVLGFYDQFAQQKSPDAKIQLEAARASRRVCEAQAALNQPEKAVTAFSRARGLLEPLLKDSPGDRDVRAELVMVYAVAPPAAFRDRDEPLRRATELAGDEPWLAGAGQLRVGWAREQSGDRRGAEAAYALAVESLSAARRDVSEAAPPQTNLELASARYRLALLLRERNDLPAARRELEASADAIRPLAEREGGPPLRTDRGPPHPMRGWATMTYMTLADVCRESGDAGAAGRAMQNAGRYGFGGKDFGMGPGGKKGGPWDGKKDFGPQPKE